MSCTSRFQAKQEEVTDWEADSHLYRAPSLKGSGSLDYKSPIWLVDIWCLWRVIDIIGYGNLLCWVKSKPYMAVCIYVGWKVRYRNRLLVATVITNIVQVIITLQINIQILEIFTLKTKVILKLILDRKYMYFGSYEFLRHNKILLLEAPKSIATLYRCYKSLLLTLTKKAKMAYT